MGKMKKIITNKLCDTCKVVVATYISKSGKLWCFDNGSKCLGIKKRIGITNKEILSTIDKSTGLTKAQSIAKLRKDIARDNGEEDPYVISGIKAAKIRNENGSYVSGAKKALKTKRIKDRDGLTIIDKSTIKMLSTRQSIGNDGLTNYQRSGIKGANTKVNDIDENGKNGFDRMYIKGYQAKKYLNTKLYYRSELEKSFLDSLVKKYNIEWVITNVNHGPTIKYDFKGIARSYLSDYIIDNSIFEIKSSYTWDKFGKDLLLQSKNIAKLETVFRLKKFKIILVLDKIEYNWENFRRNYVTLE